MVKKLCIYIIYFLHQNFISYIMSLYHKTYELCIVYHNFMISRPDQMIAKSKHNKERGIICPVSPFAYLTLGLVLFLAPKVL